MIYVESSALLKLYVEEAESAEARRLLVDADDWSTGRHTFVEVRRNLARILEGDSLREHRRWFERHWVEMTVVDLTEGVCQRAAEFAESTGVRTLDALHLGAAHETGGTTFPFVTFDGRLAAAARSLGWTVLGA
jgi:predicted nucleic acid-binding protein